MFVATIALDALVGHLLPPAGETQSLAAAALGALVLNLLGVLLLARPLGALVRRARRDLPAIVARDYAASWIVIVIAGALLAIGAHHHAAIQADRRATQEAVARAEAWIGDHAPAPFRRGLRSIDVFAIEQGSLYRACAPSAAGPRSYCVVVDVHRPWARSVRFAGYEPNSLFSRGVG